MQKKQISLVLLILVISLGFILATNHQAAMTLQPVALITNATSNNKSKDTSSSTNAIQILLTVDNDLAEGNDEISEIYPIVVSLNPNQHTVKLISIHPNMMLYDEDRQIKTLAEVLSTGSLESIQAMMQENFKLSIDNVVSCPISIIEDAIQLAEIPFSDGTLSFIHTVLQNPTAPHENILANAEAIAEIKTVIEAQISSTSWSSLLSLAKTLSNKVTTDFSKGDIAKLMLYAPKLTSAKVSTLSIPIENSYILSTQPSESNALYIDINANTFAIYHYLHSES